jgi:hypothetical protein
MIMLLVVIVIINLGDCLPRLCVHLCERLVLCQAGTRVNHAGSRPARFNGFTFSGDNECRLSYCIDERVIKIAVMA